MVDDQQRVSVEDRSASAAIRRGAEMARAAVAAAVAAVRRNPGLTAAVTAYSVLLLVFRPAMPFEWDEVLFQRALDDYNVAQHSPHPPGYPVYIGAAKLVRLLVGDPFLALQLVGVLSAVGALLTVYWLVGRLTGERAAGAAACALLAVVPGFAFYANVGFSDVASAAAGAAAAAMLVVAIDRLALLPWAAAAVAVAMGTRPQLAALLLPLVVFAAIRAARTRQWRALTVAAVVGVVVTDLIWLPAMYATGPGFWAAWQDHARTLSVVERTLRLPGARLADLAPFWLVRAFGSAATAYAFWALVALGSAAWLRAGRRAVVAVCASSAAVYLAAGMFTRNMTTAVRYVVPAIPFLAIMAAGVVVVPWRAVRRVGAAVLAAWCLAALLWAAPVYALRRQAAPAWGALAWIRDHYDPSRTTVVFDGFFEPHAQYVLGRAGFQIVKLEPTKVYGPWMQPRGTVLYACPKPVAGGKVLYEAHWDSERLRHLTRNRYDEGAVTQAPEAGEPVFSPEWRVREADWELWGTGAVCLGDLVAPRVVLLQAGDNQLRLRRAAAPPLTVKPGAPVEALLMPGEAGCLLINGPGGIHSHLPPVQTYPLRPAPGRDGVTTAAVLPLVVSMPIEGGGQWRSDTFIYNVGAKPLSLVAQYLSSGRDNSSAPTVPFTLQPGAANVVRDVVAAAGLAPWGPTGALLLYVGDTAPGCDGDECGFTFFSRTYGPRTPGGPPRIGEGLPAIAGEHGLYGGGRATFDHVSNDAATKGYVSVATWMPQATRVALSVRTRDKKELAATEVEIPPFGHVLVPFPGRVTDGQLWVQLVKPPATALFYPAVTQVSAATGEPVHLLATPSRKTAPPEWLRVRPHRLPLAPPPGPRETRR